MNQHLFKLLRIKYTTQRVWPFFWRKTKVSYTAVGTVTPNLNIPGTYKDEHGKIWFAQDQNEEGTIISCVANLPFKEPTEFCRVLVSKAK